MKMLTNGEDASETNTYASAVLEARGGSALTRYAGGGGFTRGSLEGRKSSSLSYLPHRFGPTALRPIASKIENP